MKKHIKKHNKILITGAAGFIGFHLAEKLLLRGHSVVGVDQINDYYDVYLKYDRLKYSGIDIDKEMERGVTSLKHKDYKFYKCSIEEKESLDKIFKKEKPDAVCNLAAQAGVRYSIENPDVYIQSNIVGFQNLIDTSKKYGVKNFSYASSSSVYGGNEDLPFSEKDNVDNPISLYAATKKSNELVAFTYSHLFKIKTTGLRFFTVYGPWGRPDMAYFLFVKALFCEESIDVFNHGNMLRDFTYIDDIIEGVVNVIENPAVAPKNKSKSNPTCAPYEIYNIGNNNPVKLMDFISSIEKKIGKNFTINFKEPQPGDVPATYANIDKLTTAFNFKPSTSIDIGISRFIDWYIEYYKIKL